MLEYGWKNYSKPYGFYSYGIEIELSDLSRSFFRNKNTYHGFHCKEDGSLFYSHFTKTGVEFVSDPLTRVELARAVIRLYKNLYKDRVLSDDGDDGVYLRDAGIHIHYNKKRNPDSRPHNTYNFSDWYCRLSPFEQTLISGRVANRFCNANVGRYRPINTLNSATNEVRIFSSTLDAEQVLHYINVTETIIEFTNKGKFDFNRFEYMFYTRWGYELDIDVYGWGEARLKILESFFW